MKQYKTCNFTAFFLLTVNQSALWAGQVKLIEMTGGVGGLKP